MRGDGSVCTNFCNGETQNRQQDALIDTHTPELITLVRARNLHDRACAASVLKKYVVKYKYLTKHSKTSIRLHKNFTTLTSVLFCPSPDWTNPVFCLLVTHPARAASARVFAPWPSRATNLGQLEGLLLLHGAGVAADPAVDLVTSVHQHHVIVVQILPRSPKVNKGHQRSPGQTDGEARRVRGVHQRTLACWTVLVGTL